MFRNVRVAPRRISFSSDAQKLEHLNALATKGAADREIQETAARLVRHLRPDDYMGMARAVHEWARDAIRYQHDPNRREQLADAASVAARGRDDCDGKAVYATALWRSLGLEGRVWPVWRGGALAHVQWAARWPGSAARSSNPDGWIVGDVTIRGAEFGQDPFTVARNPETGKLPLA